MEMEADKLNRNKINYHSRQGNHARISASLGAQSVRVTFDNGIIVGVKRAENSSKAQLEHSSVSD